MRPSEDDFIREQGFTTEGCREGLYSALMFQPRVSAFVPRHNPFDAVFNHAIADPMRHAAVPSAPAPRRFAQAMAGTFAMGVAMTLFAGVSHLAWLLEGVFVAASMSVVVRRLCLPARVYHRLWPRTPVTPCPSR